MSPLLKEYKFRIAAMTDEAMRQCLELPMSKLDDLLHECQDRSVTAPGSERLAATVLAAACQTIKDERGHGLLAKNLA